MKASATETSEIKLPPEAVAADAKLRESAARVKAMVKAKQEAEPNDEDPAVMSAKNAPKRKKAPAKRKPAKKAATKPRTQKTAVKARKRGVLVRDAAFHNKAASKKKPARRRRKTKTVDRHDGKDLNYPKTFEEGQEHVAAVRQKVTQCPPAKAAGIKTQADVQNPKTEVKMRKRTKATATKTRKSTTRRKPVARKGPARKTSTRKTTAKKAPARKTTATKPRGDDLQKKIKVTTATNPRKAGTQAHKRWAKLKVSATVGAFLEKTKKAGLGNCRGFLNTEVAAGRVKLTK